MVQIISSRLIREPKTKEDVLHNVACRAENITSWLLIDEYECALTIAKGLVKDLERAVAMKLAEVKSLKP